MDLKSLLNPSEGAGASSTLREDRLLRGDEQHSACSNSVLGSISPPQKAWLAAASENERTYMRGEARGNLHGAMPVLINWMHDNHEDSSDWTVYHQPICIATDQGKLRTSESIHSPHDPLEPPVPTSEFSDSNRALKQDKPRVIWPVTGNSFDRQATPPIECQIPRIHATGDDTSTSRLLRLGFTSHNPSDQYGIAEQGLRGQGAPEAHNFASADHMIGENVCQSQERFAVIIDTERASKAADEKRGRNAAASAKFRRRRKEKEAHVDVCISNYEIEVQKLKSENDLLLRECHHLREWILGFSSSELPMAHLQSNPAQAHSSRGLESGSCSSKGWSRVKAHPPVIPTASSYMIVQVARDQRLP